MKITVSPELNTIEVIRRAGYGLVIDRAAREQSWSRRLGSGLYPRFHAYIDQSVINLHLDQKQASYSGYLAHNGEYDSETVRREASRIITVIQGLKEEKSANTRPSRQPEKKGFFSWFFGG